MCPDWRFLLVGKSDDCLLRVQRSVFVYDPIDFKAVDGNEDVGLLVCQPPAAK